jgi:hypothetical protein
MPDIQETCGFYVYKQSKKSVTLKRIVLYLSTVIAGMPVYKEEKQIMSLENEFAEYLKKPLSDASASEIYEAMVDLVKARSAALPKIRSNKKVYYISA